ncbi:hydrolase [Endozoicomonas montiporae]|uniref:Hydrolase n=2 Tax=Endozoicomonas montiporae TaxID=1027273 RepID=A0A081N8Y2_9GAMM|nr:MBL fold metallo-hydrolase [Endozoicomonas montiporae]AMO55170.1 N-acyl-phosphatidylethanolamine-hydrolyzing phospholipase D [Endozoicomonas montiporae CL-33]KEQ14905.1 hydrolase [Endozoicomonas montiporae]
MTVGISSNAFADSRITGTDLLSNGKFQNASGEKAAGLSSFPKIMWRTMGEKSSDATPSQTIPVEPLTLSAMEKLEGTLAVKLGHSSILLRLNEGYWLMDPVFSERASPVQWAGPKRFHEAPIELEALPDLEGVIISHDHYDHLDKDTILKLENRVKQFYVPLGVGKLMQTWGVAEDKITELDWWESALHGDIKLVATPAQHFSGRGLMDRNKTLWASWVIMTDSERFFFSGDSGYFDGFKTIGDRYGPFDLTFIETGAYHQEWANIHMFPEESVQAHKDLRGKWMVPVHNATFDLALHAWYEPLERVIAAGKKHNQQVLTPKFGEILQLESPEPRKPWW